MEQQELSALKFNAVEEYKATLVKELRQTKDNFVPVNRLLEIIDATKIEQVKQCPRCNKEVMDLTFHLAINCPPVELFKT